MNKKSKFSRVITLLSISLLSLTLFSLSAGEAPLEEWNKTFGGTAGDAAYSIQQIKGDGYILAGNTKSYGSGGSDAWLIKVGRTTDETAKAPIASPIQTLTAIPTGTQTVKPTEKIAGFEVILAITIFLAVYLARRKRG